MKKNGHNFIKVGLFELMKTTKTHAQAMIEMSERIGYEIDIYSIGTSWHHLIFARVKHGAKKA
jgi:hypothetical protein